MAWCRVKEEEKLKGNWPGAKPPFMLERVRQDPRILRFRAGHFTQTLNIAQICDAKVEISGLPRLAHLENREGDATSCGNGVVSRCTIRRLWDLTTGCNSNAVWILVTALPTLSPFVNSQE